MNTMKNITVEKVTLNIGVGAPGDKLDKAAKLLQSISGLKPVKTTSNKRIPTWGVRPKLPLACKVTVRRKKAEILLKRLLQAADNKIPKRKFDVFGNFSFGIPEYIDIPDVPYDPGIGVIGLEVAVTLERPGFRIKRRSVKKSSVGNRHKISVEDAVQFLKEKFNVSVMEEE